MKLLARHELRHFFHYKAEEVDVGGRQLRHFYVEVHSLEQKLVLQQRKFGGIGNALFSPHDTVLRGDGNEKHYWIFRLKNEKS